MTRKRERLTFAIEADTAEEPTTLQGTAAVFNQVSPDGILIRPGAFTKTLQENKDIRMYWAHNGSKPLARGANGTLSLEETETGLDVNATPNRGTEWGRSALAAVARGDVDEMSIGFESVKEGIDEIADESVRVIQEIRLFEVSPVSEARFPTTTVTAFDKEAAANQPEPVLAAHSTETAGDETKGLSKAKARMLLRLAESGV